MHFITFAQTVKTMGPRLRSYWEWFALSILGIYSVCILQILHVQSALFHFRFFFSLHLSGYGATCPPPCPKSTQPRIWMQSLMWFWQRMSFIPPRVVRCRCCFRFSANNFNLLPLSSVVFFLCILISVFLIFVRGQCAFLGPYCNCAGLDLKHSCYWPTSPVPKKIRLFWKRSHMLPSCQRSLPLGKHPSGIALPMWLSWRSATFPQVESDILRRSWRSNIAGLNLLQKKDKNSLFHPSGSNMLLARPPDFFAQRLNLNSPTMPSKSYCPTQKFQVVGFALTTGPERSCCPTLTQSLAECMTLGCFGARTFEIFWSSTSALMLFLGTLGFFVLLVQCRICKWYLWGRNSNAWCRGPATMSQGHHPAQKCPNWHMNGAKHAKHLYAKCVFVCLSV